MVKTVAGISDDDPVEEAFEKLKACCEDEAVADLLGLASGVLEALEGDRSPQEIAWAARAFVEKLAETQPVVLVFEDIHWAEEPLLELIEHLADWVRAPLLLLCLARAELLEVHPGWGGGRVRATAIELEALGVSESEQLVEALLAEETGALGADVRRALLEKTEGNPLFVEETIRMVLERGGNGSVERIPDTLQALIAARIDRLPPTHRSLLRRAAVIGRVFWVGALEHLSPDVENIREAVDDLLLRDFLLPESRSSISGELAFRFKHVLIREVAYAGLSKSARADHHARFAGWLKESAGDELIEIRAYHLDQAVSLLAELDGSAPEELTHEAAEALHAAGRRALAREANRSARKLLVRAAELEPTLIHRYRAALAARRLADLPALSAEMELVARDAEEAGEQRIYGLALTGLAEAALLRDADVPKAKDLVEAALEALEDADASEIRGTVDARPDRLVARRPGRGRAVLDEGAGRRARGRPQARGERRHLRAGRCLQVRLELDRVQPLLERARELAEESGSIVARAMALGSWSELHYLRGDLDEAEDHGEQARELLAEAGSAWRLARIMLFLAHIARRKGDGAKAERLLRESIRILKPLEDRGSLCESQRLLAEILLGQGKIEEAERFALEAIETVGRHDRISVATTTMTLGVVRAAQGRDEEAERLLREGADRPCRDQLPGDRARRARGARSVLPRARPRRGGCRFRAPSARAGPGRCDRRRVREQGRADRLTRLLVRRLADHRRRPLEPRQRLASGSARSVPSP